MSPQRFPIWLPATRYELTQRNYYSVSLWVYLTFSIGKGFALISQYRYSFRDSGYIDSVSSLQLMSTSHHINPHIMVGGTWASISTDITWEVSRTPFRADFKAFSVRFLKKSTNRSDLKPLLFAYAFFSSFQLSKKGAPTMRSGPETRGKWERRLLDAWENRCSHGLTLWLYQTQTLNRVGGRERSCFKENPSDLLGGLRRRRFKERLEE